MGVADNKRNQIRFKSSHKGNISITVLDRLAYGETAKRVVRRLDCAVCSVNALLVQEARS